MADGDDSKILTGVESSGSASGGNGEDLPPESGERLPLVPESLQSGEEDFEGGTAEAPGAAQESETGPAGAGEHVVQQGECVFSLAFEAGHFWETVWNHPDNGGLKKLRGDPSLLLPGDRLTIPPIRAKEKPAGTDRRHRFVRRGVPEIFRLRLLDQNGQPRAGLKYCIVIDGRSSEGVTDGNGELKVPIPPDARRGNLILRDTEEEYPVVLGHLDPIDSVAGVQARLNSLGFSCGPVDGVPGRRTRTAIRNFQARHGLTVSGAMDEATRSRLASEYGS